MITTIALILAANAIRPGGDMRDVSMRPLAVGGPTSTLTLDAMPYTRTVTCGSYTLTGTFTGSTPTWSASPSGASGSCSDTGGGTFSCVVDVDPDATGEGVETITVTNGASDTETIGFYVDGEHSCFLSQNIDGVYNSTLANLDAVATLENLGSSALDVTQGTGTAQPTYRTSIVGGQPVVRCDGGDRLAASTASDWTFLNDGTDFTASYVFATLSSDPNAFQNIASTSTGTGASSSRGLSLFHDDRVGVSREDRAMFFLSSGTVTNFSIQSADDKAPAAVFNAITAVLDDDGGGGSDGFQYCNGAACGAAGVSGSYSGSTPGGGLTLCAETDGGSPLTGDLFRVLIYQSALSATQRGINKAVDEWALGGTLPVTP